MYESKGTHQTDGIDFIIINLVVNISVIIVFWESIHPPRGDCP